MTDDLTDRGPISFRLWFPRWEKLDDGRINCRVQASSGGTSQLEDGTAEVIAEILADLGVADAKTPVWSLVRYRTPFFSSFPDSDNWRNRLIYAWDLDITFEGDISGAETERGPHSSYVFDPTFPDELEDWRRPQDRVCVIALGDAREMAELPAVEAVDTTSCPGATVLDLGILELPETIPSVDTVLAACTQRGLVTNWRSADPEHR